MNLFPNIVINRIDTKMKYYNIKISFVGPIWLNGSANKSGNKFRIFILFVETCL